MNDNEEKVTIKLKKELLSSEKKEIKQHHTRVFLIALLCLLFLLSGTFLGIYISKKTNGLAQTIVTNNKYDRIATYMDSMWLYGDDYEDLNETLADNAYRGMVGFSDDPYTTYFSAEEAESFSTNINGSYVGIGCMYQKQDGAFVITKVFKLSPANDAGIKAGDILLAVDDKDISGLTIDEVKELVVGETGTKVKLTLKRNGEILDLNVTRQEVSYTAYAYTQDDYVILELSSFGENTAKEIKSYLDNYTNYSKIIIDLRNDTGGYEVALQEICGLFLGKDKVIYRETDKNGNAKDVLSTGDTYYDNFKKVVLITNNYTASAAEVFTIAMKELHEDCTQVGITTYGKGVVQLTLPIGDGSYLKMTTYYWTSPSGISFNGTGIEPDIEVTQHELFTTKTGTFAQDDVFEYDDNNQNVKVMQLMLDYLDYEVDRTDGYFSEATKATLNEFKKDNNLEEDGILDYDTYIEMVSKVQYNLYNNKTKDNQFMAAVELVEE